MQNEVRHPILSVIVLLFFGGAIGTWLVFNFYVLPRRTREVDQKLIRPYFALVDEGRFEEAWRNYTTERFRHEWPLERYQERWKEHLDHLGKVTKRNWLYSGWGSSSYGDSKSSFGFGLKVQTWFEHKGMYVVKYQVADENGGPRLDWSGSTRMEGRDTPSPNRLFRPDPY